MGEKGNAAFTVAMLAAVILMFTVADFFAGDRLYSEAENRILASRPEFTLQGLFGGSFTSDYEEYVTDQFVGRDKWIAIKTMTEIALWKKEINGVYLGADGYLLEQHLPEQYTVSQEAKKTAMLGRLAQDWNAMVMLVPTADNVMRFRLPPNAPSYDQRRLLERASQMVDDSRYVDVYQALQGHAQEEIYYRTDHHWTSLGAYYGYLAWAEKTGKEPFPYQVTNMVTVSEDFLGTLHSRLNLDWRKDRIQYFRETDQQAVQVVYDLQTQKDSCYEPAYLETKNQYGFFLDDNHAFIEIHTENRNGESLFVLKDSYANCFIPLLLPHYEHIYVVDLRYFKGRLYGLMEQYGTRKEMDVLVLYNCVHFLEDFWYAE